MGIIKTEEGEAPKAGDGGSTQPPVLATALPRDGFVPPWYGAAPGEVATRTLRLRRWTSLTDPKPGTFADLQAACDALAPNETVAIEIADQGPLFLREIRATKGKKLILRAAAGYEPLLVLEPPAQSDGTAAPATQYLFDSGKVELELEGLHFAAMLDGSMGTAPISLVRAGSAVTVRRCTFTVVQDPRYRTVGDPANAAQRPAFGAGEVITPRRGNADRAAAAGPTGPREFAASVSAVRVGGMASAAEAGRDSPQAAPIRVLVENCFIRGAAVAALSVETPAADVLVRNTLVVSGDAPALEVLSGSPAPNQEEIILRVIGSTLVSERNGVLLAHATGTGKPPTAHVQVLDSTIAHPRGGGTGELLLADRWSAGTQLRGVHWQSRNSRYLGWSKLAAVTKPRRTVATTSDDWRALWSVEQPEVTIDAAGGPTRPKAAPGSVTADAFAESHTDTAPPDDVPPDDAPPEVTHKDAETEPDSAANSTQIGAVQRKTAKDPIGCAIDALPALPAYLHERAFQPFALPEPPQFGPAGSNAPPIRIELTDPQTDLATELRRTQWEENQWIVVRGSGQRLVSPIRIEGKSLRLQFEAARGGEPLTLVPRLGRAGEAMIEVIGGDLEIVGGRFESTKAQPSSPNWLIRAAGGNVQLTNCWLKGPYPPTEHFEGVLFWGRGSPAAPAQAQMAPAEKFCRLTNCLLVGTGSLIYAWMPGRNLFVENTAAATSGEVFDLELAGPDDPAGAVTVRQSTLWAHGAFFKVGGTSAAGGIDRLPLRLSALQCVFASPLELAGRPHRTMLLACDPNLISEAQIAWHGRDNGYADLRDAFTPVVGAGAGAAETEARPLSATDFDRKWRRIWGPWHEQHPLLGTRIAWRTGKIQSNELKPGDFMLADDSEAQTWGPAGGSLGAETGRLPAAPPEDAGRGDAKDKPVLNF